MVHVATTNHTPRILAKADQAGFYGLDYLVATMG